MFWRCCEYSKEKSLSNSSAHGVSKERPGAASMKTTLQFSQLANNQPSLRLYILETWNTLQCIHFSHFLTMVSSKYVNPSQGFLELSPTLPPPQQCCSYNGSRKTFCHPKIRWRQEILLTSCLHTISRVTLTPGRATAWWWPLVFFCCTCMTTCAFLGELANGQMSDRMASLLLHLLSCSHAHQKSLEDISTLHASSLHLHNVPSLQHSFSVCCMAPSQSSKWSLMTSAGEVFLD